MRRDHKDSLEIIKETHTPEAIRHRLSQKPGHSYLRDFVYGGMDGAVTTFAIISGVAGAGLSTAIILIMGLANLLADGFSMAVGAYLSAKTETELLQRARKMEEHHIQEYPEGEKEEVRQIFSSKGFKGDDLEKIVEVITADKEQWINTMIQEEFGLSLYGPSPKRAGIATFTAFNLVGFIPLISFIAKWIVPEAALNPYLLSAMMTGAAFFAVGALKGQFVSESWFKTGMEAFILGSFAAAIAYFVGFFLKGLL